MEASSIGDDDMIFGSSQFFMDTFNQMHMTPETDELLMASLHTFHTLVAPYHADHPEKNFDVCYYSLVLNKIPYESLEPYNEDALEILADHLCATVDYVIENKKYHKRIYYFLAVCYSRIPENENGNKFLQRFEDLVKLMDYASEDSFGDVVARDFSPEKMLIPKDWLRKEEPFCDVFEKIFESLIKMVQEDDEELEIDPNYFLSIAPLAVVLKNIKLVGLIAKVLPHFEAGAFSESEKEVKNFVFACRALLPAKEALPVVEYFIGSEYFKMCAEVVPLLHFTGKPVPDDLKADMERYENFLASLKNAISLFTQFKDFNVTSEEKQELLNASQLLVFRSDPGLLTQEMLITSVKEMQNAVISSFKNVEFTSENWQDSTIVSSVLAFLLRADKYLPVNFEVAYIFMDAASARLQNYLKLKATLPNAEQIWTGLQYFGPAIETAALKILQHTRINPNTLTLKLVINGFLMMEKLNLNCENHWMDAVMLDESSTPEMWAVVYNRMKVQYGDANLIFSSFLYWHLLRSRTEQRIQFISKLISFYEEREAVSSTALDFAKILLKS